MSLLLQDWPSQSTGRTRKARNLGTGRNLTQLVGVTQWVRQYNSHPT